MGMTRGRYQIRLATLAKQYASLRASSIILLHERARMTPAEIGKALCLSTHMVHRTLTDHYARTKRIIHVESNATDPAYHYDAPKQRTAIEI